MLKHVVLFKFSPEATAVEIADLEQSLKALPGQIAEIRSFEVGRDIVRSPRSYDLGLLSEFDDLEALNRYQVHPVHQLVVEKVKRLCNGVVAVDFPC